MEVEYPFIAIFQGSLRPGVVVSLRILCIGKIDQFKYYSYSVRPYAKKKDLLKNNYTKRMNLNVQETGFLNTETWNNAKLVDIPLKSINHF